MIEIREALPGDYPSILELIKELAVYEKEPNAVVIDVAELERSQELFCCFVALYDGVVVGMSLCYPRFSTWKGKTIHLEDLIVTRSMRGKGIGKALYKKVIQHAYEQGVRRVEWVVLDWNKNAIEFYEHSGAAILKDWYLAKMDEDALKKYVAIHEDI